MKNALLLAARELRAYARSPLGYVVAAAVLLGEGTYFYALGLRGTQLSTDVLRIFFEAANGGTIFLAAVLAMKLIAGERENGTLVLLNTAPIRERELVLGKFLAGLAFLSLLGLITAYMPALIFVNGKVSVAHMAVGYLGVVMGGGGAAALGGFCSGLFRNQLAAGIVGGLIAIYMSVMAWMMADIVDPPFTDIVEYTAIFNQHFVPLMEGRISVSSVVYHVTLSALFLLLSTQILHGRRWE